MDAVSETPVSEASRGTGSWLTAAFAVAGLIVIAVVVVATVTSNGKGAGFGPATRAQDRAVQSDLRNALTAEKTIYTDNMQYSSKIAEMRSIESSLDWGGRLHVVVDESDRPPTITKPGDVDPAIIDSGVPDFSFDTTPCSGGNVVCLDETSTSGTTFSIGDVAAGSRAGTYYGKRGCPSVATPEAVSSLGMSWDGSSSSVSWGGALDRTPHSSCATEMATFQTAIAAYQAMGPHPWPEGDVNAVKATLIRAGLLVPGQVLHYNSPTSPSELDTWYYDGATHKFTSSCDA